MKVLEPEIFAPSPCPYRRWLRGIATVLLWLAAANAASATGDGPTPEEGAAQCLAWIEETYHVESLTRDLDLDLSEDYETIRACVTRDSLVLGPEKAVKYCDNVFKVHCSGVDLLAEIGEALVSRCEEQLAASSGLKPREDKAWKTCGQHRVFERYSTKGEPSDEAACKAAWSECSSGDDGEEPVAWSQWGGPEPGLQSPGQRPGSDLARGRPRETVEPRPGRRLLGDPRRGRPSLHHVQGR